MHYESDTSICFLVVVTALMTEEKILYLLTSKDAWISTLLGKLFYHILDDQNKHLSEVKWPLFTVL